MIFNDVVDHIVKLYVAGVRQTQYLTGPPGIGKSAACKRIAQLLAEHYELPFFDYGHDGNNAPSAHFGFRALPMTVVDPLDFGGLSAVLDKGDGPYAQRLPFVDLVPSTGMSIIVYDDLPTAPPLTQAAAFRTIWERDGVSPDCMIIGTGNRAEDRAGVQRMPTPLVSKMSWLDFEPDRSGWTEHMAGTSGDPVVRAFIQHETGLNNFVNFKPEVPGPFACPRTWEALSDQCRAYTPRLPPFEAIKGIVGEGPAIEFSTFASMASELVSTAQILANPDTAPVPTNPGALYVVGGGLANAARHDNLDHIVRYLFRMEEEFAVYTMKSALAADAARLKSLPPNEQNRYQRLQKSAAFVRFCAKFQDLLS